jgi:hypothetical protein
MLAPKDELGYCLNTIIDGDLLFGECYCMGKVRLLLPSSSG